MVGIRHLDRLDAAVAQLAHVLADRNAFEARAGLLLDDEGGDALLGPGGQQDDGGPLAVGHPGLAPVEDVLVPVAEGPARDVASVAPGIGLGERERTAPFSRGHGGEPAPLLFLRAVRHDHGGRHGVGVHDPREAHPAVGQLLNDADVGQQVEAEAAVLLGDGDAEEAERAHLLDDLLGKCVGALEIGRHGDDLALHETPDGLDDLRPDILVGRGRKRAAHSADNHTLRWC